MHADVADLQVAQAQRARVQVGIELGHQPQLAHRLLTGVGETERVGQRIVGRHVAQAVGRGQRLRAAHGDQCVGRGFAGRRLLQVLRQVERLRTHRVELGIEHAQVAQVFQLGAAAGKHVEADEVRLLRRAPVIVGTIGRHRHRDLGVVALVVLAHFVVVDRRGGGQRITGVARSVAVPLLHLGEEAQQVGLGAVAVAAAADQDAGGQRGVQAQHQLIGADGRRLSLGAQQAGGLQRGQPALHPLRLVGGQHAQRGRRVGIGQDGGAQRDGMRRLVGHELGARQRRGRAQRVEAERHRQRLELGDVLVGLTREELGRQAVADLVEILHTTVEQATRLPVGADRIQLGAQALEVVGQPFGQARVGLHAEVEADKAAGGHVEGIARRQVPARRVVHAVERGPGDVAAQRGGGRGAVGLGVAQPFGHGALRLAAHVAAEHHVGQFQALQHIGALPQVRGAHVEAHVRRVDVAQALQRHAVERRIARGNAARAADADGDVGLDHALDQVAVGLDHTLAVGVGHHHVVQAVGHVAQIEGGADQRGGYHLPAGRLDLEFTRTAQLDQRAGGEACAFYVHRHPAVRIVTGAALVGRDTGDGQRQQFGAQRHRRAGGLLARAHQQVVITGLGAGDHDLLVGRDRLIVGGVEGVAGGDVAPAQPDLVGARRGAGIEREAQRLALGHGQAVQPHVAAAQRGGHQRADRQRGHFHAQRGGGGGAVVGLARRHVQAGLGVGDAAFEDLVVEVGPHDDAPSAVLQRWQLSAERAVVAGVGGQIAHMGHLADQQVVQAPAVVGRQIDRVGPAAIGRVDRRHVGDGVVELHRLAHLRAGGQLHVGDLQVGRRRGLDQHRLQRRAVVVVVEAELEHAAGITAAPGTRRVGDHEDVVRPFQIPRRGEVERGRVITTGEQAAVVLDVAEVAVLVQVEKAVLAEVDQVVPAALVGGRAPALVLHRPAHAEGLAGQHRQWRAHLRDLQVGRRRQADRQRDLAQVVGLVAELEHRARRAGVVVGHGVQAIAHGAGHAAVEVLGGAGVGLDDQREFAADRGGQREGGAVGIALAGLQVARLAIGGGAHRGLAHTQLGFGPGAPVDHRVVAEVEGGIARQVDTVVPAVDPRGPPAGVGDRPADGDGFARGRVGVAELDRAHLQVGLAVGDVERAGAEVVAALRAFVDAGGVEVVACVGVVLAGECLELGHLATGRPAEIRRQRTPTVQRIGDDVDEVRPVGAGGQRQQRAAGVALATAQRAGIGMHHRADLRGAAGDEFRVAAEVDVVHPAARAGPHRAAVVGDGPAHQRGLAGEVLWLGDHAADLQVGRCSADRRGRTARVVALVGLAHLVVQVGLHHQEGTRHRGRQRHALRHAVRFAQSQAALLAVLAHQPAHSGLAQVGVVGHPDPVGPAAVEGIGAVGDGVAEGITSACSGLGRCHGGGDHQVGRGDAQYRHRPGLVVVVVDLAGVVGIDVDRQRVFEDRIVGVAPHRQVVLARAHAFGDQHVQRAEVILAHGQVAGVGDLADLDVALAGRRPALVDGEPDGVGPAVDSRGVAQRGGRALVGHLVAHFHRAAVHHLVGCDHVAGHQVAERHRVDVQALGAGVVGFARVLVDAVVGIGHDDDEDITAVADRDGHRRDLGGITLAGVQRSGAVLARQQHVVAAEDAVQRQVDPVGPLAAGALGAHVGHGVAHRGAGAGGHAGGHGDGGHAQVGPRVQADLDGVTVDQRVVGAGGTVLVDLRAAATQCAVGDHAQAVGTPDLARQAHLLGAAVGDAGLEPAVVVEGAQRDDPAIGGHQLHRVLPLAGRAGLALVAHRPVDVDQRTLLRHRGRVDRVDHQVGRRRQRHRHRHRAAGVVAGVDELERPTGADVEEPVALDALGQAHLDAAVVAVARGQLAQVAGRAQVVARAAAVGVGRQPDRVGPRRGVGDADAAVGHRPFDRDHLPRGGHAARADRFNPQIGVGNGHHVHGLDGLGLVVGLAGVLPHRAGGVGAHHHRAVAAEGGAEAVAQGLGVLVTGLQCGVARHRAQHDVVAVADDGIGAVDHPVQPLGGAARAGAQVLHRPFDGDRGRVGDHPRGRGHVDHRQVGVTVAGDVDAQAVEVVVLADAVFVVGIGRVGDHDQAPVAFQVDRQVEGQLARGAAAGGDACMQHLAQQHVARAHHAVARQVDAVAHVDGLGAAGVERGPAQRDPLAALQQAGGRQALQRQVGADHRHVEAAEVVGLVRFTDITAIVSVHLQ